MKIVHSFLVALTTIYYFFVASESPVQAQVTIPFRVCSDKSERFSEEEHLAKFRRDSSGNISRYEYRLGSIESAIRNPGWRRDFYIFHEYQGLSGMGDIGLRKGTRSYGEYNRLCSTEFPRSSRVFGERNSRVTLIDSYSYTIDKVEWTGKSFIVTVIPSGNKNIGQVIQFVRPTAQDAGDIKLTIVTQKGEKLQSVVSYPDPSKRLPIAKSENQCSLAISKAESRIRKVTNLIRSYSKSHGYKDYPAGKGESIIFVIGPLNHKDTAGAVSANNLLASKVLLRYISGQIIQDCERFGIVGFGFDQSDDILTYGLVDKDIKVFECLTRVPEYFISRSGAKFNTVSWGYIHCF